MTASYGLSLLPLTSPGLLLSLTLPAFTASLPAARVQGSQPPQMLFSRTPSLPPGVGVGGCLSSQGLCASSRLSPGRRHTLSPSVQGSQTSPLPAPWETGWT